MGCDGMKKYTYVGACASLVHILERLNRKYGTTCLVHSTVEEEAKQAFRFRLLDAVWVRHLDSSAPVSVLELLCSREVSEKEWMYQLKDDEDGDGHPETIFGRAVEACLSGNFVQALSC
eukprot:PhM_4_TR13901/c2_g1_i11/m.96074